jgi:membrane protein
MNKHSYREPFLCMALLVIMIFEVPFFKLFLISGAVMLILYTVIYKRHPFIDVAVVVLILFIVLYFAIDTKLESSTEYKVWYAISTISLYAYGDYMDFDGLSTKERSEKVTSVIKTIAIAYAAFVLVTMVYSIMKGQFAITRNPLNIWTGTLRAATHFGTMSLIPLAYGLYLIIATRSKMSHKYGWMLIIFVSLVAIITGSRTALFLVPIGFIIAYLADIKIQGVFTKKNLNQLLGALILFAFVTVAFLGDAFGFQTLFYKSQLGQRYLLGYAPTMTEDGRWKKTVFFFENISKSLWGGGYTRSNVGSIHNIYLDVFDLSGIIPFGLLIIFTLIVIGDYRRLRKSASVDDSTALLLLLICSLTFIQLLLEPVMESVPVMIWCLLLICGMQHKVSRYT